MSYASYSCSVGRAVYIIKGDLDCDELKVDTVIAVCWKNSVSFLKFIHVSIYSYLLPSAESISISMYSFGVISLPCCSSYFLHISKRLLYLPSSSTRRISYCPFASFMI